MRNEARYLIIWEASTTIKKNMVEASQLYMVLIVHRISCVDAIVMCTLD